MLFKYFINIYILIIIIDDSSATESSQASTTSTITDIFAKQRAAKRPKTSEKEVFNIIKFKKLLLNFIIFNNLSFRSVTSQSFKELLFYLSKDIPSIYYKALKDDLIFFYKEKKFFIQEELNNNIKSNGSFFITLDGWTAIN